MDDQHLNANPSLSYKDQLSKTYERFGSFFDDTFYTNQESYDLFEAFKYVSFSISRAISDGIDPFNLTFEEFFNNTDPNAQQYLLFLDRIKPEHMFRTDLSGIKVENFIYLASDLMSAQYDTNWNKERTLIQLS